jgi:hypothetical protein
MKAILLALLLPVTAFASTKSNQQALADLCANSDAVVHIRVEATPAPGDGKHFTVSDVSLVRILKQTDSFPGRTAVTYALTIKRPGNIISEKDWEVRHPGDYVIFCRLPPAGDVLGYELPSLDVWSLYKDNDSEIQSACHPADSTKPAAAH